MATAIPLPRHELLRPGSPFLLSRYSVGTALAAALQLHRSVYGSWRFNRCCSSGLAPRRRQQVAEPLRAKHSCEPLQGALSLASDGHLAKTACETPTCCMPCPGSVRVGCSTPLMYTVRGDITPPAFTYTDKAASAKASNEHRKSFRPCSCTYIDMGRTRYFPSGCGLPLTAFLSMVKVRIQRP